MEYKSFNTPDTEFDVYSSMYDQFMKLPLIQKLIKDNRRLTKSNNKLLQKNNDLVELLLSLNKKSNVCSCINCKCNIKNKKISPLRKQVSESQCCKSK